MRNRGLIASVPRQEWLSPVENTLQKATHAVVGQGESRRGLRNFLHGTWLGHPLHVILTDIPLGSWTAAVVCDALESITGDDRVGDAADYAIGIGLIGAAGAAITGLTDWADTDEPARRIGVVHALLNVAGVALFTGSLVTRRRSRASGKGLAALGYACSTLAARFGGNLVYEQRIGVDRTAGQEFPAEFTPLLPESALTENQPRRAEHKGVPILLIRRGERIFALPATCSHLGGPLDEGTIEGRSVQCPWHGSRFSLDDGRVLDGPAVHPLPCLEARVHDGQVEVRKQRPAGKVQAEGSAGSLTERRTGTMG